MRKLEIDGHHGIGLQRGKHALLHTVGIRGGGVGGKMARGQGEKADDIKQLSHVYFPSFSSFLILRCALA